MHLSLYQRYMWKNDEMFKNYVRLFTCATTRNVQLELTPSMDASDVSLSTAPFKQRMHQNVYKQ